MVEQNKEYHKEGFVSHNKLATKYNMNYLLNKVVDFEILAKRKKDIGILTKEKKTEQLKAIIGIMALTGCRVSEALSLKFDDFIFEEDYDKRLWMTLTLKNLKGKKNSKNSKLAIKRVPILVDKSLMFYKPFIRPIISWYKTVLNWKGMGVWKTTSFLIFENWSRWMVYYYCYKYLDINPHGFRKIYTSYLVVEKEYPIKVVQRIIGHRDLKNLDYYINLRTEDIKKAVLERADKI